MDELRADWVRDTLATYPFFLKAFPTQLETGALAVDGCEEGRWGSQAAFRPLSCFETALKVPALANSTSLPKITQQLSNEFEKT